MALDPGEKGFGKIFDDIVFPKGEVIRKRKISLRERFKRDPASFIFFLFSMFWPVALLVLFVLKQYGVISFAS